MNSERWFRLCVRRELLCLLSCGDSDCGIVLTHNTLMTADHLSKNVARDGDVCVSLIEVWCRKKWPKANSQLLSSSPLAWKLLPSSPSIYPPPPPRRFFRTHAHADDRICNLGLNVHVFDWRLSSFFFFYLFFVSFRFVFGVVHFVSLIRSAVSLLLLLFIYLPKDWYWIIWSRSIEVTFTFISSTSSDRCWRWMGRARVNVTRAKTAFAGVCVCVHMSSTAICSKLEIATCIQIRCSRRLDNFRFNCLCLMRYVLIHFRFVRRTQHSTALARKRTKNKQT